MQVSPRRATFVRLSPLPARSEPGPPEPARATPEPDSFEGTPPPPPPRRWLRKALIWTGVGAATLTALGGAAGTIAYFGNHQALQGLGQVQFYPTKLPAPAPTPGPDAPVRPRVTPSSKVPPPGGTRVTPSSKVPPPGGTRVTPSSKVPPPGGTRVYPPEAVEVNLNGQTVRDFLTRLTGTPRVQAQLQPRLEEARQTVQERLQTLPVPPGELLLEVQAPLPTAEHSFMRVGSLNLPSLGYHGLQSESVPLALSYQAAPIQTDLQVRMTPFQPEHPPTGPGLFLGAVRVEVSSPSGKVTLEGQAGLEADLHGQAGQRALDRLQGLPGQEPLVARLQARQQSARRMAESLERQGLAPAVSQVAHQQLHYHATLSMPHQVADTTVYLWSVPDRTGDGRADLALTQTANLDGLEQVQLQLDELQFGPNPGQSKLARSLHEKARAAVETNLREQLPRLTEELRSLIHSQAEEGARAGLVAAESQANTFLGQVYQHNHLDLHGADPRGSRLQLDLGRVAVVGDGLRVGLSLPRATGPASTLTGPSLQAGQGAVTIELSSLNRQLQDRSQGGAVRWADQLEAMRAKADLRSLEFGKDAQGRTLYPTLQMQNGRLRLHAEVVARTKTGLGPIFNGLFGSTVRRHIAVPLDVKVVEGRLVVAADTHDLEFQKAQAESPFDLFDLMPTRIVTNLLANVLVSAGGVSPPAGANAELDLRQPFGLEMTSARLDAKGNLTVVARVGPQTAEWVGEHLP